MDLEYLSPTSEAGVLTHSLALSINDVGIRDPVPRLSLPIKFRNSEVQIILEWMQSKTSVIFTAIPNKNGSVTLKTDELVLIFIREVPAACRCGCPHSAKQRVVQLTQVSSFFPVIVCIDTLVACAEIDKDNFSLLFPINLLVR